MIIRSLLDTDLYKLTMQQIVFHRFPEATAEYRLISRTHGVDLRPYAADIRREVEAFCRLTFSDEEIAYLRTYPFFRGDYLDAIRELRLDPDDVIIDTEPEFGLRVRGNWFQTILFEVPLLAICNETYCRGAYPLTTERLAEGQKRLSEKCRLIAGSDVPIRLSEFGTRRRYSREWQSHVIDELAVCMPDSLLGTSNVMDARRLGTPAVGTMGHEYLQAFQVLTEIGDSQRQALSTWHDEFGDYLGIALSDVIGLDAFLYDFDRELAGEYAGARHDSGDPMIWGDRLIAHYEKLGIDPHTKIAVFTDGLTITRAIEIAHYFAGRIRVSFGIGTHLTNDFDFEAPQIVIKLVRCNGRPVAKLSDSPGKSVCDDPGYIERLKAVFAARCATNPRGG